MFCFKNLTMNSVVPATPAGLCIHRENFIGAEFSADAFLQYLWNDVPHEVLRDDLGAYLKVLRSAMIELINRDYVDFVNLSGNLIGLDKAIANLQEPLVVIESEILNVEKVLNEAESKLLLALNQRQNLRERKLVVGSIMKVPNYLEHLEKLLENVTTETVTTMLEDNPAKGNVIERAANEFNQLQHLLMKCGDNPVTSNLKLRVEQVDSNLMNRMEEALFFGIDGKKKEIVQKTLYTFMVLDKCSYAENLIRVRLIEPTFDTLLNQNSLKRDPQDLSGLLLKVKEFISQQLKDLVDISASCEDPSGFNLIPHCIWPEFYEALVTNLDCIFAQGNPDLLHKRYISTTEFLDYLDSLYKGSGSQSLRNDPKYQQLLNRWNLPVYFQIRFQELAGQLESSLADPFAPTNKEQSPFNLKSTDSLMNMMNACFNPDIFLPPLAHRFWKLCLQLMARFQMRFRDVLLEVKQIDAASSLAKSSSSTKLMELENNSGILASGASLQNLVQLDSDITLILENIPNVWTNAWKRFELLGLKDPVVFENAFQASAQSLRNISIPIGKMMVNELYGQCAIHLRTVGDIPRLYRRTNKEAPTKCFNYVHQMLSVINDFRSLHQDHTKNVDEWTRGVLQVLSKQYHIAVSDVLTSVQKTEESLKRLRKDRVTSVLNGINDDDKIRMQLVIDVDAYVEATRIILNDTTPEMTALIDAVDSARQICRRNQPST